MLHNLVHLDIVLFSFINSHHTPFFDVFFILVTQLGNGIFAIPLTGLLLVFFTPRTMLARTLLVAAVAGTLTGVLDTQIKRSVDRPRPLACYTLGTSQIHVVGERLRQQSFPSGHTATAFSAATILFLFIRKKFSLFYIPAVFVAYSRIYVGAHFPLDTVAGAILGCSLSALVILFFRRWVFPTPPAIQESSHD